MVICATCGTDNRDDRRFCRSCGSTLGQTCAACGTLNEPGDRFCGHCGTALGGDAGQSGQGSGGTADGGPADGGAASEASAGGGTERRVVSVLFADLVGFTSLADSRDPEAVRDLLSRYFDVAREIVARYGGEIEKFIGDAVMAVWGTPLAHEDDAERAVRAGLDLVDAVAGIAPVGEALQARAAILTGEAAVTLGAVNQGMVAGDLVNTASRLQSVAPPGSVLVGEATVRASEASIVYEAIGEQALRGKSAPVPAWQAVRVVAGRRGFGRTRRLEPPFVGRDQELRLLKDLFHTSVRDGRARLVSVVGIAGVGKSRLVWELEKYIDGLAEAVYWHQGRSPAYGDGVALWALGEMIRGRAGIAELDEPDAAHAKLRAMLEEFVPDDVEHAWVEPRLAAVLGIEPTPPGGSEELFAAWRTLFERITDRGPTILVFEDLQWADPVLIDFIEDILARSRSRPIFIVTLARPELLERRPTWGAGQRSFTSLELGPLAADEMEMLLVGLVPGLPQAAIRAIRDRAEGVPLYAVETVRMLLDRGRLTEHDGRYRLSGELGTLEVPTSLTGLIGARLDDLPDVERSVLGHAAVLGESFQAAALVATSGMDPAGVNASLDALARKELVTLITDPRSPERGQYRFVQGLLREVAYGRLSKRERLARHLAAAQHLAELDDEELAGVVASHYVEAWQAALDTARAGELADRARQALLAAAERAVSLRAASQAVGYLDRAAELSTEASERLTIRERAGTIALDGLPPDRAVDRLGPLLDEYRALGDPAGVARVAWMLGRAIVYAGRPAEGVQVLSGALEEVGDAGGDPAVIRLRAELGRAHLMSGSAQLALPVLERAIDAAEQIDDRATLAELFASKGWADAATGRLQQGIALLRAALRLAEQADATTARFRAAMNLSGHLVADDPREAFTIAREHAEMARRLGYYEWAQSLAGNASDVAFSIGDWAFIEDLSRQIDADEISGLFRMAVHINLAIVEACRGRRERGWEILDDVRRGYASSEDPQVRLAMPIMASIIALVGDDPIGAMRFVDEALTVGFDLGDHSVEMLGVRAAIWARDPIAVERYLRPILETGMQGRHRRIRLRLALAGRAAIEGRAEEAERAYDEGLRELAGYDLPVDMALAIIERIRALPDSPNVPELAAQARAILGPIGADGLEALLPHGPDTTGDQFATDAQPRPGAAQAPAARTG